MIKAILLGILFLVLTVASYHAADQCAANGGQWLVLGRLGQCVMPR